MKKFLRISSKLIQMNFMRNIVYNFDFIISMLNTIVYTATFLFANEFIFRSVDRIFGYSRDQFVIFILFGQIWFYLQVIFVRKNFQYLNELVSTGKINFELIKPYNIRVYASLFRFDFRHVMTFFIISSYLIYKLTFIHLTFWQILGTIVFLVNSVILVHSFVQIYFGLNLNNSSGNEILDLVYEFPDLVKTPVSFFPFVLQIVFILILPVLITLNPIF